MNITELIVELLQKGQRVELPEIGTFDSVTQAPRHDTASGTYYPATRNIVFRPGTSGDNSMVKIIAERDCVNEDVARQMWVNYTDALNEKIQRTGEHQFGPLGTLTKAGSGFAFEMSEGVVIEAGGSTEKPIEGVKTYDHSGSADPFAQFEEEEPVGTVVQRPEPVRAPEPEPELEAVPEPEPKPEAEPEPALAEKEEVVAEEVKAEEVVDEAWQEKLKQVEELPKSKAMLKAEAKAEKARIKAEAKAEKERAKLRKRAQRDHDSAERRMEEDREAEARREAEDRHRAEKELRKAEQKAEEGRLRAEKEAEAALQRAEKKAEEERMKATKRAAALAALAAAGQTAQSAGTEAAPLATNPAAMAQQEAKEELERQVAAKQKEMERAEKEAARKAKEAEAEAARQAKEAEKEAARRLKEEKRQAEEAAKEAARQAKEAEKEAARNAKAAKKEAAKAAALAAKATEGEEKEEKKSRKGWLWLLLLLLLLLLAGGAYYFLKMKPQSGVASTELAGKHFDAPNVNSLTFNTDLIDYSSREITRNTDQVCRTMSDYVNEFLADQGYRNARTAMMDHVRQYADQRLGEMMGPRMAAQRFLPYEDYVYQDAEPWLRQRYAYQSRGQVQGELMDEGFMDRMLNRIIDDYGIMPDNAQAPTAAPAQAAAPAPAATPAQPAAATKKATLPDDNPVYVYVEKESKQGFDIVAGFYLNKATAARMAARLHELGCDAYIIEKNEMYYVSMGSAPTRTKAEALYKHIKSWYDGDVVIKEL